MGVELRGYDYKGLIRRKESLGGIEIYRIASQLRK